MKVEVHLHLWFDGILKNCLTKQIDFKGIDYLNVGMKLRLKSLSLRHSLTIQDIYIIEGEELPHVHLNEPVESIHMVNRILPGLIGLGWEEHPI